ncbi:MAG: hypothetical protein CMM47_00860 [Rhodospirillaceae bacterium]|nr:hypothetical protein [Rhodospirillaceae bacterium]
MTVQEWESLCDGCGKCCLIKLIDDVTDELHFTTVACRLLDCSSCRCGDYANRKTLVPDCVMLSPRIVEELQWMPSTCAYRLLREGKELPWWHPLVSGRAETVNEAGVSVRGRAVSERDVPNESLPDYISDWPE